MSCYICSNKTISVIAEAFISYDVAFVASDYTPQNGWIIDLNTRRHDIGQSLLNYNIDAYDCRYGEISEPEEFEYEDVILTYPLIYDCIREYEYQACEIPDYESSDIHKSLVRLKKVMLDNIIESMRE